MDINALKKDLESVASTIRYKWVNADGVEEILTYDRMTPQQLADAYCDMDEAGNEFGRDQYWAALLLRYWYYIYKWYAMPRTLGEGFEELFDWLNESVKCAMWYRSWRPRRKFEVKEGKKVVGIRWDENPQYASALEKGAIDEYVADRSIHYFLAAQRGRVYQEANKQLRRGNYQAMSIDSSFDENGYSVLDRMGLSVDGGFDDPVADIINALIAEGKEMEAVMVDFIANGDSQKCGVKKGTYKITNTDGEEEEVEYKAQTSEFSPRKVVAEIKSLQESNSVEQYLAQFMANYKLQDSSNLLEKLSTINSPKVYKLIELTIQTLRSKPELINALTHR